MQFKSKERASPPLVKFREVLAYAAHPFPQVGKLIGRALTVFWKSVVQWLELREMIATSEMLSRQNDLGRTSSGPGRSVTLQKCSQTSNAPQVVEALTNLASRVLSPINRTTPLAFYIAKGRSRRLDIWMKGEQLMLP